MMKTLQKFRSCLTNVETAFMLVMSMTLILFLGTSFDGYGQVTGVKYLMKYNPLTTHQDCYIVVTEGSATSPGQRAQFNSQISVVAPGGTEIEIAQNYMPLNNHVNYNGTAPLNWILASSVKNPDVTPNKNYFSIVPTLSPTSFYNNMEKGDTIKLFSLKTSPVFCNNELRFFSNLIDPKSNAKGMNGGDFTNYFTVGGIGPDYQGNLFEASSCLTETTEVMSSLRINPTLFDDHLVIESPKGLNQLSVINSYGQQIFNECFLHGEVQKLIDTNTWSVGLYYIISKNALGQVSKKKVLKIK